MFAGITKKNTRLSKKGFFPVSLHRGVKGQGHGQGLLMSCPGLLKTTLLGNCIKKKIKEKIREALRNVKFSLNFRKCKLKEIKKLNSYITTHVQKNTGSPLGDIAPLPTPPHPPKIAEKTSSPEIITVQNSSAPLPLILRRGLIPCIIEHLPENQDLNLFLVK